MCMDDFPFVQQPRLRDASRVYVGRWRVKIGRGVVGHVPNIQSDFRFYPHRQAPAYRRKNLRDIDFFFSLTLIP